MNKVNFMCRSVATNINLTVKFPELFMMDHFLSNLSLSLFLLVAEFDVCELQFIRPQRLVDIIYGLLIGRLPRSATVNTSR